MDWKKLYKKALFLPFWLMLLLTVLCAGGLAAVFILGWEKTVPAYLLFALSFYTLTVDVLYAWLIFPDHYRTIKQKVYDNPLGNRLASDPVYRTHVLLYVSLTVNLLYVAVNILSYFLYRSMWFVVLGTYYCILAFMRFLLARYTTKTGIGNNIKGEWRLARLCAWILLSLNLFLSGAVLMILYQNKGFQYHGILIYVMALYTFYMTTNAIINLIRYSKFKSPLMSVTKVISLCVALVSMLSLETAMFAQFGQEMALENQRLMIALTGGGVSLVVITLSVLMIVYSTKAIRE